MISSASKAAAREAGAKTYIGSPCPLGHTKRYTVNGSCTECDLAYQNSKPKDHNAYQRYWWATNTERGRKRNRRNMARFWARHPFYHHRYADQIAHRRAVQINTLRVIYGKPL